MAHRRTPLARGELNTAMRRPGHRAYHTPHLPLMLTRLSQVPEDLPRPSPALPDRRRPPLAPPHHLPATPRLPTTTGALPSSRQVDWYPPLRRRPHRRRASTPTRRLPPLSLSYTPTPSPQRAHTSAPWARKGLSSKGFPRNFQRNKIYLFLLFLFELSKFIENSTKFQK